MNLLKKNKAVFILAVLLLLSFGLWTFYQYGFTAPSKTNEIPAEYQGSAQDFKQLILTDFDEWHNKIIQITGTVTAIQEDGILLNQNIYCQFETMPTDVVEIDRINLKGRVIGYDDLLEETKLSQCIIIE